jgi:hypothetical protein
MSNQQYGTVYRIPQADQARLRQLVAAYVELPGWTCGGAALWEFDPQRGQENLRPMTLFNDIHDLRTDGDFGHAFSGAAEVRWKRRDQDTYDVLILSETTLDIADAEPLGASWIVQDSGKLAIIQSTRHRYPPIAYRTYHAPNGAVQFIRYTEVRV